ncbi:MAG: NADH-quinone oxidoreductase subunit E [Candidatus Pelagibacter sp. TMED64]|nr:NADH-quinone oxidoreductase subunit E [Candidatus Pelagibacter sp.]OUU67560.1 MAG: NADH-quinone oxidoreductase subunit E [Candidatus Pelagibacter sp. TMED64]|tara:strand:+ start:169 stop:780 length:612 start_codon:yes stop_codon:yes gene_type:complete
MSIKNVAANQPDSFEFTKENLLIKDLILKKYPKTKIQSSVMPLLSLAQSQNNNWIPLVAIKYIAALLDMPYIKVYEVATFYSMYNLAPVGDYFVQVCTTTPCMIRGSSKIVDVCKKYISEKENQISKNKKCSWVEVECLGACVNAPMMQINDNYFEDLDEKSAEKIIKDLMIDKLPKPGSYRNRKNSAPEKNRKTLLETINAK